MSRFTQVLGPSALMFLAAALAAPLAHAKSDAQQRYEQERKACMDGTSNQDRATCLKEAGAALAESKKGNLSADASMERNRTARCVVAHRCKAAHEVHHADTICR